MFKINAKRRIDVAATQRWRAFLFGRFFLKNHPPLVAKPIIELEHEMMSNAHRMRDVPLKRSAQIFLDIIRQEAIPYINELEKFIEL